MNAALTGLARGFYYIATMLLFGGMAFGALLLRRLPVIVPPRLTAWRWSLLMMALIAALAWMALRGAQIADAMDGALVKATVTDTWFIRLFLLRLGLLALLGVTFLLRNGQVAGVALAAGALVLPAATSHAAAASPAGFAAIGATMDAMHLLTAGLWLGGLALLAVLFARREPNMLLAVSLFSDVAMIAVLLLIMTGLVDAASILLGGANGKGGASPVYLTVLTAKLVLVAAMLGLAAANRFRLLPAARTAGLARNVALELGLGLTAVLLAGVLGRLQPAL